MNRAMIHIVHRDIPCKLMLSCSHRQELQLAEVVRTLLPLFQYLPLGLHFHRGHPMVLYRES